MSRDLSELFPSLSPEPEPDVPGSTWNTGAVSLGILSNIFTTQAKQVWGPVSILEIFVEIPFDAWIEPPDRWFELRVGGSRYLRYTIVSGGTIRWIPGPNPLFIAGDSSAELVCPIEFSSTLTFATGPIPSPASRTVTIENNPSERMISFDD